jgi:hypothetical protein
MSNISILETNLEGLSQTLVSLNNLAERSREVSLTITKVEEAIMWLHKAVCFAQLPIVLSDDNSDPVVPKKAKKKTESQVTKVILMENPNVVGLVVEEPKAEPIVITEPKAEPIVITQEPAKVSISIEDVRMNFKNFCQSNSIEKGKDILASFNVTNISELYKLGDEKVIMFCNLIV